MGSEDSYSVNKQHENCWVSKFFTFFVGVLFINKMMMSREKNFYVARKKSTFLFTFQGRDPVNLNFTSCYLKLFRL